MTVAIAESGKSSLTNALLKSYLTKENDRISARTLKMKEYSNPIKLPGITIYDTVGKEILKNKYDFLTIRELIEKYSEIIYKIPKNRFMELYIVLLKIILEFKIGKFIS